MTGGARGAAGSYDFDLHGVVGVRLLDATTDDLATVRRQLGPLQTELDGEPDLTIRFVDEIPGRAMTYVGVGDTGFDDSGFYILRGRGGVRARTLLPFADIGRKPEIVCERRVPAVPHLLALINLTALDKGVLPLHASAFVTRSTGVLVTGWAKGGKTESLLGAMDEDGCYVGDEWIYLTPDGQMLGLPEPIRLWGWHLDQLPATLRARPRTERARLAAWRSMARLAGAAAASRVPAGGVVRRAVPIIERQAYLQIPPAELFGADRLAVHGNLDAVVLVVTHTSPDITVGAAGRTEVSGRMRASLAAERDAFMAHYAQFRYAFPELAAPVVDDAAVTEARLLAELFDDRPAAKVAHPYPCDIRVLGTAVVSAALDTTTAGGTRPAGGA